MQTDTGENIKPVNKLSHPGNEPPATRDLFKKYPGLRSFTDLKNKIPPLIVNPELKIEDDKSIGLNYLTPDGLTVNLNMAPLPESEADDLGTLMPVREDASTMLYFKISKYEITGDAGSRDLVKIYPNKFSLITPVGPHLYSGFKFLNTGSTMTDRVKAYEACVHTTDNRNAYLEMPLIIGKEGVVIFEHEADHLLAIQSGQRVGEVDQPSTIDEEAVANTGTEYYGKAALDSVCSDQMENERIARLVSGISVQLHSEAKNATPKKTGLRIRHSLEDEGPTISLPPLPEGLTVLK